MLAHGLLGFDELRLAGSFLPSIKYWRGVADALEAKGIKVYTASVSASGSIEQRADMLSQSIAEKVRSRGVNIIAHSMVSYTPMSNEPGQPKSTQGGLDSRYMISHIKPANVDVLSLTTIATPHRGSSFADYVFERIGPNSIPRVYSAMTSLGLEHGAFSQLTRRHMQEQFNPNTPDDPGVRYFSYGATFNPGLFSAFRLSNRIIAQQEGLNDGLVSVMSSRWGGNRGYKGTLIGVSHLDLINWTNRLRWLFSELAGYKRTYVKQSIFRSVS